MGHQGFKCVKMSVTRSYILPCDTGYLLIDTAYKKDSEKFMKALDRLGIKLSDIRYILLTHHHDDHAGLVTKLTDQCDALVIAHEKAAEPLAKGANDLGEVTNRRAKMLMVLAKLSGGLTSFPPVVLRDEDLVVAGDDDQLLRKIGIEGKVLYTPGHTQDSISIVLDDGNAFVGDLASNAFKVAGTRFRPYYIDSMEELLDSWSKVLDEGAKTIYPIHGKPFPAERLRFYLDQYREA